ncbi:pyridoxamine 5'-phosphate oxidase family protein [Pseudoalteromonas espejiana]
MRAKSPTLISMQYTANEHDPVSKALNTLGAPIGLLGIELSTRRRNRLNTTVTEVVNSNTINLKVDQSFGNCPQYIQTRELNFHRDPLSNTQNIVKQPFTKFSKEAEALIDNADTMFVSSFVKAKNGSSVEGVDVSHRGGMPGFIKREGDTLTIPDYAGNFLFNTLGNFLVNPKAGLLFTNFANGDVLMLTGKVKIIWDNDPKLKGFEGAKRAWCFKLIKGMWLKKALPFTATFNEYSPNTKLTGTWQAAKKLS